MGWNGLRGRAVYNRRMKILVTGAHFTPAQAVIEELKKIEGTEVVYLGRKSTREGDPTPSAESQILPKMGVRFIPIVAGRLQRHFTIHTIPSLLKIPVGFLQSLYLLIREKPDVVLSFGGYVGVPVVFAAWLLSIPVIIHEQTLLPGLANRISSFFADRIAVTFKDGGFKGGKVVLTGNPLRSDVIHAEGKRIAADIKKVALQAEKNNLPLILIVGGNQGSHLINEAVREILPELIEIACVVHQTGDSKFEDFERLQKEVSILPDSARYLAIKWIEGQETGWLMKNAAMVVCRAGMNTLLEVSFFGTPVLIIPLPVKEQISNAKFFEKLENARVLWQKDLDEDNLLKAVRGGLAGMNGLKENAKRAREIIVPDAAKRVALETVILAKSYHAS